MIKSVVSDKYRQLCNDSTPVTDNLLGDDLDKQKLIKYLDDMRKVGKDLIKHRERNENSKVGTIMTRTENFPDTLLMLASGLKKSKATYSLFF